MLVVYVDDLKLSGPSDQHEGAWRDLGKRLKPEKPNGDDESTTTFLGCLHTIKERVIGNRTVREMTYDVTSSLKRVVDKYCELVRKGTGKEAHLIKVGTPSLEEQTRMSPHRAPRTDEAFVECPCCMHTIAKSEVDEHYTFPAGAIRKLGDIQKDLEGA